MSQTSTQIVISARDETGRAVQGAISGLDRINAAASKTRNLLAGLGTVTVGLSVAAAIKGAIDFQDRLDELRASTGLTVEQLSGLSYVAKRGGTDLEGLAKTVNKLTVEIGKNPEKFKAIGISAKDPIEALKQLSDLFVSIEDPQQRAAVAAAALGKEWQSAAPVLAEGGQKIGEMVKRGQELSGATSESAERAAKLNDQLDDLQAQGKKVGAEFANVLVPSLAATAKAMSEAAEKGNLLKSLLIGFAGMGKLPWDVGLSGLTKDLNDFSKEGRLKDLREQLDGLEKKQKQWAAAGAIKMPESIRQGVSQQIVVLRNQIAALEQYGDKIFAKTEKQTEAVEKKAAPPADAIKKFVGDDGATKQADDYTRLVKAMQERIAVLRMEMAEEGEAVNAKKAYATLLSNIENGYLKVTPAERENLEFMHQQAVALEEMGAGTKKYNEEQKRFEEMAEKYKELADPLEQYRKKLDEIQQLLSRGLLTPEQASKANKAVVDQMDQLNEKTKEQADLARDLGLTFTSAFEDAVVGGKKFSEILRSLAMDIAKLILRKTVTEPLLKEVSGWLGGIFGGGGGGDPSEFGSDFGFASGGVFNSPSLSRYSNGVYHSPQFFAFAKGAGVFAEAGPEAIMPLKRGPDGKLGVQSSGAGGNSVSIVINVSDAGASNKTSSGESQGAWSQMADRIRGVVLDEMLKQKRPGGALYA